MNAPLALRCYALLLHLYPAPFRTTFGCEMSEVFGLGLDEAVRRGGWMLIVFWLHESLSLIPAALAEHSRAWRQRRRDPAFLAYIDLLAARWIARVVSLLICGIMLSGLGTLAQPIASPTNLLQLFGLGGLLLAWRWERLGGIVISLSGLLNSLIMFGLMLLVIPSSPIIGVLCALTWGGPFLIFGWLFIKIGRRARQRAA